MEAIHTERGILRNEIIKKGETVAIIAGRNAELPILSENLEQLKRSADSLMEIKDVAFVSFCNKNFVPLIHEGKQDTSVPDPSALPEMAITFSEHADSFEFTVPVFTVRAKEEMDFFQEKAASPQLREHIGWVRIGLSKEVIRKSEREIIARGGMLAVLFNSAGVLLIYIFISLAAKPLQALFEAVKVMREGEYTEVRVTSPGSELGKLSAEFNRMSRAIREREQEIVASERKIKALFERVEHAIFGLDSRGAIIVTNKKFYELCGETKDFYSLFGGDAMGNGISKKRLWERLSRLIWRLSAGMEMRLSLICRCILISTKRVLLRDSTDILSISPRKRSLRSCSSRRRRWRAWVFLQAGLPTISTIY